MKKFLSWYKQSTKHKIIFFSIIFIISLAYSFLHRPLGLIMWDWSQRKATEQALNAIILAATNISIDDNEKRFLKLYADNNISQEKDLIAKDVLHYIDNLEIDLLASSIVGLDELYLQAFLQKAKVYTLEYVLVDIFDKIYHNTPYTQEEITFYQKFLKALDKPFYFITRLAHRDSEYERYAIQLALMQISYIYFIDNFTQEQICSLDKTLFLKKIQESEHIVNTISSSLWKEAQEKYANITRTKDAIKVMANKARGKLNECK